MWKCQDTLERIISIALFESKFMLNLKRIHRKDAAKKRTAENIKNVMFFWSRKTFK